MCAKGLRSGRGPPVQQPRVALAPSWHASGEGKAWIPEKQLRWNQDPTLGAGQVIRG